MCVTLGNFIGISPEITGKVEGDLTWYKVIQAVLTSTCIIFPISLVPKMSGLRYISMLSIFSMVYLIVLLVGEFRLYYEAYYKPDGECYNPETVFYNPLTD